MELKGRWSHILVGICDFEHGSFHVKASVSIVSEVPEEKGSPPEFIKVPHQVVAREHDCAQFLVKVVGVPKPTGKGTHIDLHSLHVYSATVEPLTKKHLHETKETPPPPTPLTHTHLF